MAIYRLGSGLGFPPVAHAEPSGLLAMGGDLRPERLLAAYGAGIFPWFSPGQPILWHAPDPRMVLGLDRLHVGRTLRRALRSRRFRVELDSAFAEVIGHCASRERPGQQGTWITAGMQRAYIRLHTLGFAHSVETFLGDRLVGGLYGVSLGRAFFGESMFSLESEASKVALCHLVGELQLRGFHFVDCQVHTDLFDSLGARPIPRDAFQHKLGQALIFPTQQGPWRWSTTDSLAPLPR